MPQYGRIQYGRHKYGRYLLATRDSGAIGPHVRYRIRHLSPNGDSEFLVMNAHRVEFPVHYPAKVRIRSNNGEWVIVQNEVISKDAPRVRIRSISKDGTMSEWVYGVSGNISLI